MKFTLANIAETKRATEYLNQLIAGKKTVEIKRLSGKRSLNQNAYLHLLLSALGLHLGYSLAEMKTIYKQDINPDIYIYKKGEHQFLKSSADLTSADMAKSIDRLHSYAQSIDYPLPLAGDEDWLRQLENAVEGASLYL